MIAHATLIRLLDTMNGVITIMSAALIVILTAYLISRRREINFLAVSLPIGMSLALAIYVREMGSLLTRLVLWAWLRVGGVSLPATGIQASLMLIGAFGMIFGLLWLIAILSRPQWGDWPWLATAAAAIVYLFHAAGWSA